ncbi:restriction endonuclease subunit S [Candidatus Pacearchaeota archaeon]|nr:restriction endonuclease subunit S [Candidatus Pacearchaeota archaeon]
MLIFLKGVMNCMYNKNKQLPDGWKEVELGGICDVRDGTHSSPEYVNEGYPLITSKNLTKGYIDFSEVNLISKKDFDEINRRSKVDSGDILMPMIGTIGNPIIIPKNIREFAIKNIALIKSSNKDISNNYIKYFLDSPYFEQVTSKFNRGGTQKFISLGDIRKIKILLPPLETQKHIVSILEKAEKLKKKREDADKKTAEYLRDIRVFLIKKLVSYVKLFLVLLQAQQMKNTGMEILIG